MRGPTAVAVIGAVAHLFCRIAFVSEGRFFASEDDPYRAYTAFLLKDDPGRLIGRMWVLGFEACHAFFQSIGVPARWAGITVNTLALLALFVGILRVMERLAPGRAPVRWCAATLLLVSPMTITLAHSSLSDLLATALIVWALDGFIAYTIDGRLSSLLRAAIAIALASWVRYEPWLLAALLVPASAFVDWRVLKQGRPSAVLLAGLAWLGPLAWLAAQQLRFGDPFHFYAQIVDTVETLSGPPDRLRVLGTQLESALYWFPPTVLLATVAWLRNPGELSGRAWLFTAGLSLGALFQLLGGHAHGTFPARLSYGLEIALLPWAAVGLAGLLQSRPRSLAALGTVLFALTALRPAAIQDSESVAFGVSLLRAEEPIPPGASLLVERPLKRPPFGWASVGVLWGRWEQTVWVTPQAAGWTVVKPSDVTAPLNLSEPEFQRWLEQNTATAAWVQSERLRAALSSKLPCADARSPEGHAFLAQGPCRH